MTTSAVPRPHVLTVDDDRSVHMALALELGDHYELSSALSAQDAVEHLYRHSADAVVLDINMPDISGIELLKLILQRYPAIPVVMLTGNTEPRIVVEAMKAGASDYVVKSSPEVGMELRFRIDQAIERQKLLGRNRALEEKIEEHEKDFEIVGHTAPILKLKSQILALKGHSTTVLITGESGTGKELVARALNIQEADKTRKLVCVNCAAITESIAESELFGHEKGAFTHAIRSQQGKFVAANGGDIFLDEIGELSLSLQSKLLRVLQERVVTPVGSTEAIPIDVRVIAATNRDLHEEVQAGRFRKDLYYRISVIPLEVPALRERWEDIPRLAEHFLRQFRAEGLRISASAISALEAHPWPGNIRELRNCMERACLMTKAAGKSTIGPEELVFSDPVYGGMAGPRVPAQLLPHREEDLDPVHRAEFIDWAERLYYEAGLKATGANKKRLAERLELSRDYMHRRLKTLQLSNSGAEVMA